MRSSRRWSESAIGLVDGRGTIIRNDGAHRPAKETRSETNARQTIIFFPMLQLYKLAERTPSGLVQPAYRAER